MNEAEGKALEYAIGEITEIAKGFGLDFYPMRYEICPSEIIYTFGAYGMPTRFSHWSFGKQFYKMKLHYDFGLSKIYELVINSNPCYAFLLDSNTLIQNKLIVAHVLAHCDFFKNNIRFQNTKRDMVESMAATADRIRKYEIQYGKHEVETFLDAVLAIEEHIDPSLMRPKLAWSLDEEADDDEEDKPQSSPYDDLWVLDKKDEPKLEPAAKKRKFPPRPEKDLLLFIESYSRELTDWQRDILTMMREEMLYFWPQLETKIMNEGWASYWHQRILREMDLTPGESIEFAKLNAGVVQPSRTGINPYYLGLKILEDIEERYNNPDEEMRRRGVIPGSGREKLFEVREIESDISFLRNYLTKDLVQREDMYLFQKQGKDYKIVDKQWEHVRDQLVSMRVNGGFPYITVNDGDYSRNGELYLKHWYEGIELDVKYLEKVLPYIYQLWGRPVHMETIIEGRTLLYSYDGKESIENICKNGEERPCRRGCSFLVQLVPEEYGSRIYQKQVLHKLISNCKLNLLEMNHKRKLMGDVMKEFVLSILMMLTDLGYFGIAIGLMIEIIPSEIVLGYGGYLVSLGKISFFGAVIAGSIGGTLAQLFLYWLGYYGGRPFLEKYGKYILIHKKHIDIAEDWFEKYGTGVIFSARFIPVVRHAISIPAGIAKMSAVKFTLYTLAAVIPWTIFFLYLGTVLGENWSDIKGFAQPYVMPVIVIALVLAAVYYFVKRRGNTNPNSL